ncbi:MAG: sn-glycerol-3-phosphate ABC transporter ATP-binding protein UgpC [Bosea sp.]|jgi:sn-glycerol 3-phosphate transport system ATP-binding protein|nr:sn-glycerol-3-phosphate ABC transporter ATP-binding protein UgpC [Bosea sp. (in: a-proteobacteria)]
MAHIDIRNVSKSYGKTQVVHGVDVAIADGEFVVILGPSGCGKSTLLRMIAGLEEISHGTIAIAGEVVNEREPRERGCAMVFQNYALYPHMSVAENIGYGLKVAGVPKAARLARVKAVATTVGLDEFLDRKPGQLSGGQRQRVAMARAMIKEPKVFLFDEPLSNLDAKLRVQMRIEIRKLHQRLKATSVFVTHDQVEAMTLADRLVIMNKGVIEQVGAPKDVYDRPASVFVASFIGAPGLNLLDAVVSADGEAVSLSDGQRLAVDTMRYPSLKPGPVTAGIRAEALTIRPLGASSGVGMKARFDFAEELGLGQHIHAEIAGQPLVIHVDGRHPYRPGAAIGIDVSPQDLQLFDAVTGLRIAEADAVVRIEEAA